MANQTIIITAPNVVFDGNGSPMSPCYQYTVSDDAVLQQLISEGFATIVDSAPVAEVAPHKEETKTPSKNLKAQETAPTNSTGEL